MTNEFCVCGRDATKVHCAKCGCATIYALVSQRQHITRPSGERAVLNSYRCRRCGIVFSDDDWQRACTAPPPRLGRPADAQPMPVATPIGDLTQRSSTEMQDVLAQVLKRRGIVMDNSPKEDDTV